MLTDIFFSLSFSYTVSKNTGFIHAVYHLDSSVCLMHKAWLNTSLHDIKNILKKYVHSLMFRNLLPSWEKKITACCRNGYIQDHKLLLTMSSHPGYTRTDLLLTILNANLLWSRHETWIWEHLQLNYNTW